MASETEIANMALSKLGDIDTIINLSENNQAARTIKAIFAPTRDAVLRGHPWNCAMKRAGLPAVIAAPPWGFARAFQLPVDCLRLIEVEGNPERRLEGRMILTDASGPLNILYVRQLENTGDWDAALGDAIAGCLAMQSAIKLTGKSELRDRLAREYGRYMPSAKMVDGQEDPSEAWAEDEWVLAREADY